MKEVKSKDELLKLLEGAKKSGKKVGFVPTMGALHKGHLSLMKICRQQNDVAVASIFVNPTQFNDKNDLKNYPRMPEVDMKMLESEGCDIVFSPEVEEMYPEPDTRVFEFGNLGNVMEGSHRPGHFNGVAQIVSKLFDCVMPDNAYFGEKDFQQLAIIKQLVRKNNLSINIVACPIIREADGLAMSSRNLLLGKNERENAPLIYKTLSKAVSLKNEYSVTDLKKWVLEQVNTCPYLAVEYFEIVDDSELMPVSSWNDKSNKVGCIAVKAGNIRLIDNIRFN
jgi:pantoate--beta-alanine ligase